MNDSTTMMMQPHGYSLILTKKHCPELDELQKHLTILRDTLNEEYNNLCAAYPQEVHQFLEDGLSQGHFRDAVTKLIGKPYLNWEFHGSRSRYWRMLTTYTYQQFSSRYQRSRLIDLIEEHNYTEPSAELWDEIRKRKIKTTINELNNVLRWRAKETARKNKVTPVPIDYSATDESMIDQKVVDNVVHVTMTCVRKEKFHISYPLPPHIVTRYQVGKVSKPVFDIVDDGSIRLRYTVFTTVQPVSHDGILGVDLGKVKPFSAASVIPNGSYSQELVCSREVEHLSQKLDRLRAHKEYVYAKKMRLYSLINSPYQPDPLAVQSYTVLCAEYSSLVSRITKIKEHMGWLVARDVVVHAVSSNCGAIHMEDLSWLASVGGKWNHSSVQAKIDHRAKSDGIKVHKVDAYGTSWEFPEEYAVNPAPHASLNTTTRELTSLISDKKVDKDYAASIAIACRGKKKRGERASVSSRKRVIQPKKCRDKHCSTPKRPRLAKKHPIIINKPTPQYVSVTADATVGNESLSQVVKNTYGPGMMECPYMPYSK